MINKYARSSETSVVLLLYEDVTFFFSCFAIVLSLPVTFFFPCCFAIVLSLPLRIKMYCSTFLCLYFSPPVCACDVLFYYLDLGLIVLCLILFLGGSGLSVALVNIDFAR